MDKSIVKILFVIILMNHFSSLNSEMLRAPPQLHDYAFTKFRPPPPPVQQRPEPTFMQRITSWFFPWGVSTEEEELSIPASPKIDHLPSAPPQQQHQPIITQPSPLPRLNPVQVRDTEPTTARTTRATQSKCSPCNKVPWIPMIPTYQLPLVKGNQQQNQQQQQQVYFKHHFGNENQYAQVPPNVGYKYSPPSSSSAAVVSTTQSSNLNYKYGVPQVTFSTPSYKYGYPPPSSTLPPSTTPIKFIQESFQGHHIYGVPSSNVPIKILQPTYKYSTPSVAFPPVTTLRPNSNTIDTSVITFTTNRPQNNNRPLRYTQNSVTNPEYIPPPNILPIEGENQGFAPIPIPNLSPTPIPPLFDAQQFHENPYTNQKTGFIKIVPLEPVAQLSSNVNVQVKPDGKENNVEVISSNLVAAFTIPPEVNESQSNYRGTARLNIDIGNNLDTFNATLNVPIVVESVESNTDSAIAETENDYQHNINQALDVVSFDQLKGVDDVTIPEEDKNRVFPPREYDNNDNDEEDRVITTTEGNYIVKFEPSIQTANDLADEAKKKKTNQTNYRQTPLELLDSPIFHITTEKPTLPPFKPIEDYRKTLSTLWYAATTTEIPITTTEIPTTTVKVLPTTTISYLTKILLPNETVRPISFGQPTKKPKQIQIVIPYSTYHKPSPFKPQDEQEILTYKSIRGYYVTHPPRTKETTSTMTTTTSTTASATTQKSPLVSFEPLFNGHGYHNDQEYETVQESKIVESKVPKPTRQLTKVVANNIRDLLKKEKTPKPSKPKIDLLKLQRNIDGWTEQSFKGKASTMALMGHTKAIPSSFLTTTMRATSYMKFPTTTLAPKTTFDPDLMEETKRQYDNILYKKDEPYVKRHDRFLDRDNELLLINNNLTQSNALQEGVRVYAPKSTLSPKELWKKLHLTVSPLTNEKIYVVTPLPFTKKNSTENSTSAYKPRFAIRPTLGIKAAKKMKPEVSRRMDNSMDLIDIETIDGQSKVVKIITPERKEVTNSIDSTSTTEKSSSRS